MKQAKQAKQVNGPWQIGGWTNAPLDLKAAIADIILTPTDIIVEGARMIHECSEGNQYIRRAFSPLP